MIVNGTVRSGNKKVDEYIETLEKEIESFYASNSKKLIRSIDAMAGKISEELHLIATDQKNADGSEVELSSKNIDTYLKMVDKADKIEKFVAVADSMFGTTEKTVITETKTEKKTVSSGNIFEETQKLIKGKIK